MIEYISRRDRRRNYFTKLSEADEPTEKDADMSGNNGMGPQGGAEPDAKPDGAAGGGEDELNAEMPDDGQGAEPEPSAEEGAEQGDDMGGGGMDSGDSGLDGDSEGSEDALKKRRLFQDYKDLYFMMDELIDLTVTIPYNNLSSDSKKIFNFIENKMKENFDKIKIIITEKFSSLEYKELLTLFLLLKHSTKSYSELIQYFKENNSNE